jgi:hypothetical protein
VALPVARLPGAVIFPVPLPPDEHNDRTDGHAATWNWSFPLCVDPPGEWAWYYTAHERWHERARTEG